MLLFILAACGGEEAEGEIGVFTGAPDEPLLASTGGDGAASGPAQQLSIGTGTGATLAFSQAEMSATTGSIELTFQNDGSIPHNWTLAREGEADAVNTEGSGSAPDYQAPSALAQTATIEGGAADTITFNISEPGTYIYLCTFPGHYAAGMKGTMVVEQGEGGTTEGAAPAPSGPAVELVSNTGTGAALVYAEPELTASGGNINLTFNNVGSIPHNWTLVNPEEEQAVATDAQSNPDQYTSEMALAQTPMLDGGASETISFSVAPGTYSFICTFPGHYAAGMKGTLVIE